MRPATRWAPLRIVAAIPVCNHLITAPNSRPVPFAILQDAINQRDQENNGTEPVEDFLSDG
jgi:hypothetical protein